MINDYLKPVEMDGVTYNIRMASAVDQRSVMFKMARYGLMEAVKQMALAEIGSARADLVALTIVGRMIQLMPEDDFNFVCDKLLDRAAVHGGKQVTIEDFRGDMQKYVKLVVLALGVNFSDFSSLLTMFQKSFDSSGQEQGTTSEPTPTGSSGDPAQE